MINPTHFFYGISVLYFFYYFFNLLFDLLVSSSQASRADAVLIDLPSFEEPIDASAIDPGGAEPEAEEPERYLSSGSISTSGGVSIEEIIGLAEGDAILLTNQISS
ncbi:hypothetical protein [Pedobacter miscanthi]|uniref:hypothetical protein n=1 Tax=Pedobacter miscanthi TaxID=2259170 RepID=UPI00292CAC63|nr:hypothetical protein [Pedobacter miscanthi]